MAFKLKMNRHTRSIIKYQAVKNEITGGGLKTIISNYCRNQLDIELKSLI